MGLDSVVNGLRMFLIDSGLTQKQIAEILGVSHQSVNGLLNGRRSFGRKTAEEWSKHFGLSSSWLITGDGNMYDSKVDVSNLYIKRTGDIKNSVVGNNSTNNNGGDNEIISKLLNELAAQRKQNQELIELLKSQLSK